MKQLTTSKSMIPIGLLLLSSSLVIKHFIPALPDFLDGLLKGLSIGIIGIAVIKTRHPKQYPDS